MKALYAIAFAILLLCACEGGGGGEEENDEFIHEEEGKNGEEISERIGEHFEEQARRERVEASAERW